MSTMGRKYLVLSDIHCRDWVADRAKDLIREHSMDAVILLGDITHFGPPQWAGEFIKSLGAKCYAIPGNCDPPGTMGFIERNSISLHARKVMVDGVIWGGLGGSNPTIFKTPFEMPEEEIARLLSPIMETGMVLLLHCPPHGILDMPFSEKHVGSTAIRDLIDKFRPLVVLSGHIHEDRGIVKNDGIWYMNPGAAKDHYAGMMEMGEEPSFTLLDL
ncbi:MAG TPA: metallophosphoesterase [Methanomassiliicoccales archaeon]|nr:metallophosphoesterase [Methanomassiliicoccales archaeon]